MRKTIPAGLHWESFSSELDQTDSAAIVFHCWSAEMELSKDLNQHHTAGQGYSVGGRRNILDSLLHHPGFQNKVLQHSCSKIEGE